MNTNLDSALAFIFHSCQSEANADRNPPDYWFSFSRRYREPLDGIMSKDMVQSYVSAPERSRASHPYAYGIRRVDGHIPAQQDIVEVTGEEENYDFDVADNDHSYGPAPVQMGSLEPAPVTPRPSSDRLLTYEQAVKLAGVNSARFDAANVASVIVGTRIMYRAADVRKAFPRR